MIRLKIYLGICLFILAFKSFSADCPINFETYNLDVGEDCSVCGGKSPSVQNSIASTVSPVIGFVTNSEEQKKEIRKFKVLEHFLSKEIHKKQCSNYGELKLRFQREFKAKLELCEKGPDLLERTKVTCQFVLETFSRKMTDSFYAHWSTVDTKGNVTLIAGRYKEQIEQPIRSHFMWCQKVKKNYKQKIYVDCKDAEDWVSEFNRLKKISESVRRDLEQSVENSSSEDLRRKMFQEGCKYFDNNPATTFTRDLYMACLTQ